MHSRNVVCHGFGILSVGQERLKPRCLSFGTFSPWKFMALQCPIGAEPLDAETSTTVLLFAILPWKTTLCVTNRKWVDNTQKKAENDATRDSYVRHRNQKEINRIVQDANKNGECFICIRRQAFIRSRKRMTSVSSAGSPRPAALCSTSFWASDTNNSNLMST